MLNPTGYFLEKYSLRGTQLTGKESHATVWRVTKRITEDADGPRTRSLKKNQRLVELQSRKVNNPV